MLKFKFIYNFFSEHDTLDLDGQGGRTFLRVLLHLAMHDYPPLLSGALHLLFRHFSQRQEVLQAFKQVRVNKQTFYTTSFLTKINWMSYFIVWLFSGTIAGLRQ